jgi:hypothetical protein
LKNNNFTFFKSINDFNNFREKLDREFIRQIIHNLKDRYINTRVRYKKRFIKKVIKKLGLFKEEEYKNNDIKEKNNNFLEKDLKPLVDLYLDLLKDTDLIKIVVLCFTASKKIWCVSYDAFRKLNKKINIRIKKLDRTMTVSYLLNKFFDDNIIIYPVTGRFISNKCERNSHKFLEYDEDSYQFNKYYCLSNEINHRFISRFALIKDYVLYSFYQDCKSEDLPKVLKIVFPNGKFDTYYNYISYSNYILYEKEWNNIEILYLINYIDSFREITIPDVYEIKRNYLREMGLCNIYYNDKRIINKQILEKIEIKPIYRIFDSKFREKFKKENCFDKLKKTQ